MVYQIKIHTKDLKSNLAGKIYSAYVNLNFIDVVDIIGEWIEKVSRDKQIDIDVEECKDELRIKSFTSIILGEEIFIHLYEFRQDEFEFEFTKVLYSWFKNDDGITVTHVGEKFHFFDCSERKESLHYVTVYKGDVSGRSILVNFELQKIVDLVGEMINEVFKVDVAEFKEELIKSYISGVDLQDKSKCIVRISSPLVEDEMRVYLSKTLDLCLKSTN
jgi:hypothetical protein